MTAYLQPGDKIHLAIPVPATLRRKDAAAQAETDASAYITDYELHGVEVVSWTAHDGLAARVVVAVFRKPDGGS